jgi:archaellum biogenesis protein FlaJ (TadC family)
VVLEELMLTSLVESLVHTFAPWQHLYADSKVVSTAVTTVHLVAMLFGGGYAVAADRATLRTRPDNQAEARRLLDELHFLHGPVVAALIVLFLSGVAMATADIETFAKSPVFAAKLAVVALLLANGLALRSTERSLQRRSADPALAGEGVAPWHQPLWRRLRATAWASAALWTAAVITGVMLTNAA